MIDPAFKRQMFERLKELNGQGRLIPEKRKKFTAKERQAVHEAYDGRCGRCDRLVGLRFEIDHIIPRFRGGPHVMANWELLCSPCHAEKTGDEAPGNAKIRRIERRELEGPKASKFKPGRKLQSPGFRTDITRSMSGEIVRRKAQA